MKLSKFSKKLIGLGLICATLSACNQSGGKSPEQLKEQIKKEIPGVDNIDAINSTPINGVSEVVVGRKIFYVTNDGKYFIFGNIIDVASKQSLTEQRTQELNKIDWNKLPLDLAIKEVNGNGSRKIAVFSDPECPYCQMFEKQVAPLLKDTTIYTFLFPLPMHKEAKPDSIKIWCSKDRTATWTAWMRDKKPLPTDTSCDTSGLEKAIKFGQDVAQIEGTPAIILENGQLLPGMLPADQLMAQMDAAAGKAPKAPAASQAK